MELRYGIIDENVLKRSVEDVILHEGQAAAGRRDKKQTWQALSHAGALTLGPGFEGGLAVVRAVNSLAADGIRARCFQPVLLLPPGTKEETLRDLMRQICRTAFSLGLDVAAGQVEVTDAVTRPVVTGCALGEPFSSRTSGESYLRCARGEPFPRRGREAVGSPSGSEREGDGGSPSGSEREGDGGSPSGSEREGDGGSPSGFEQNGDSRSPSGSEQEGDGGSEKRNPGPLGGDKGSAGLPEEKREILAAGWIGLEGTWLLTVNRMDLLRDRFPFSFLYRIEQLRQDLCIGRAAEIAAACGASAMVSLADGGVMAGLWALAKKTGRGLEADLQKIPILQETIEITDLFEIDPYLMKSAGCLLIAAEDGQALARRLSEAGIHTARVGRLLSSRNKILYNGEEIRHLDRPQTDSLAAFFVNS